MDGIVKVRFLAGWWIVSLLSVASLAAAGMDLRLVDAARSGDKKAVRALLDQGADVKASQADGATALAWAVYHDDLETAELLIAAGADVNAANDYGVSPLALACTNQNPVMVETLLKAGANPKTAQWTGETPLMTATRLGTVEVVNLLLAHGADVNAKESRRGQTALMWAIAQGYPQIARILIEQGADVRARSHQLAADGFKPKVTTTWEGDLQVSSKGGFTPLLFAAQQGDLETARLLLAAGADVDESTEEDGTALLLASANGYEQLALFLLEMGADPNATPGDGSGITALHYAMRDGMKSLLDGKSGGLFVQKTKIEQKSYTKEEADRGPLAGPDMPALMRALIAHGADPNARMLKTPARLRQGARTFASMIGTTPFLLAAASANYDGLRFLVESGAKSKVTTVVDLEVNPEGVFSDQAQIQGSATPLMAAAGIGRARDRGKEEAKKALEAVKVLVELGADVNYANETGYTALHAAAYSGADEIIQFLAEKGAKLDVQNGCGQTPLSLADGSNPRGLIAIPRARESTAALLLKLGAGATPLSGPVGRCIEGRFGIDYFTERDKKKAP
ncbi:MAG: ankyrin repeat domain-containing protein [Acidobacteria bacterium]|nr:ankyrin repeat domain-containing protein [Acidobacteriota bacterium]